jgi:spore germination protein KC
MARKKILCFILCFQLVISTGCWDRVELNDRAIWLATGWDVGEKEGVEITGQIVIPSNMQTKGSGGGGGTGSEYITVSAKGINSRNALQNMQNKLSREAFFGQRRVVMYGEKFAKRGVREEIDSNTRSPDIALRTDVFVVKGDSALKALNLTYPLEKPPATSVLKEHEQSGGKGDTAFLEFLIAANSDGIRPTLPAIEIGYFQDEHQTAKGELAKPILKLAGIAVFDQDLSLLGFMDMEETRDFNWIIGILKRRTLASEIKEGNVSVALTELTSKITPNKIQGQQVGFIVELSGEGEILENNTNLDLEKLKNLQYLQKEIEKQAKEQVQETINKVQKKYKVDIFGFGEALRKKKAKQWKSLEGEWDPYFANADITVKVDLEINRIGMSGPSLLYKESEIE